MLKLKNIIKNYYVGEQTVHALKGFDVEFGKNEFVAILGPSGCGKTTLMNIIGGLDRATDGDLLIKGKSTKNYNDNDWDNYRNKSIGFIFQSYNLIPHLTVLGNVEIALTISGISKEERREKAKKVIRQVGLENQINQKPNQLSGGQMQRVAIARALVNNPDILLADEPTGALDTENSKQIMELMKTFAKDRLVIMVTHNPDLAKEYSTRIIKMLDGNIYEDSRPLITKTEENKNFEVTKTVKRDKTKMSYLTALSLSWKNLITNKGRTLLTAIAGSIGIIGIALILATSNGVNRYVDQIQSETLASNPIVITESSINFTQAFNASQDNKLFEKFTKLQEVYVEKAIDFNDILSRNNINDNYINYLETNLNKEWYSDITYKTGQDLNFYGISVGNENYSKIVTSSDSSTSSIFGSSSVFQMLLNQEFIQTQYDLLTGTYPASSTDLVLIVDDENKIPETTLVTLGLKVFNSDVEKYNFEDIIGKTYKFVENDLMYVKSGSSFTVKSPLDINYESAKTLTITGIVRIKETTDMGVLSPGIGYLKALYTEIQNVNMSSEIVTFMNNNVNMNPFTGLMYEDTFTQTKEQQYMAQLRKVSGNDLANEISIYPVNFENKELIKTVLNEYNVGKEKEDMVTFTDLSELFASTITSVVNIITYVLIAFTAISLVVSSIMIAIITYVSVLERTKEIGVLRSIGARKKDVTRVFNSETIIIGLIAGLVGVGVAYIISIPVNIIVANLAGIQNVANLNIFAAIVLVLISVGLTLVSGLVPALKAAKQDPVKALRSE